MKRRTVLGLSAAAVAAAAASADLFAASAPRGGYFKVLERLIRDWHRNDLNAVLAHIADDIVWHSHVGSPPIIGKAAVRPVFEQLAASMLNLRWRIVNHAQVGNSLLSEGVLEFTSRDGHQIALPYMGILAFRGTLITEWRDYFDLALYERMKSGEKMPEYLQALASRPGRP